MNLVDDDHPVAVAGRPVAQHFLELADVVDPGVGCRVDLDDVEARASGDLLTGDAVTAWLGRRSLLAVDRLGQEARRRRLADAADPGKDISVSQCSGGEGVVQGSDDRILADDVGEGLRSPGAGQYLIGHGESVGEDGTAVSFRTAVADETLRHGSRMIG